MQYEMAVRQVCCVSVQNVNVVSWTVCGSLLASGGVDGNVTVWDYASRKAIKRLEVQVGEQTSQVMCVDVVGRYMYHTVPSKRPLCPLVFMCHLNVQ